MTDEPLDPSRPASASSDRRSPGDGLREIVMLLLLGLAVALLYLGNAAIAVPDPEPGRDLPADRLDLRIQAQYEVGIRQVFESAGRGLPSLGAEELSARRLDALAETPRERIALAPVHAQLSTEQDAREQAREQLSSLADDPSLDEAIRNEASTFADLFRESPILPPDDQLPGLLETYGWFARLALELAGDARAGDDGVGSTQPGALAEARRVALGLFALAVGFFAVFVLGVCLSFVFLLRLSSGQVRSAYRRSELAMPSDAAERLPYLETALLFLVAVTVVGGLVGLAMDAVGPWALLGNWAVVAVFAWPRVRGRSASDLRRALGWHRGRGVLVEMACGVFAYLAAMPLLAVGLALTLLATRFTDQPPHHPIVDWLQESGAGGIAVVVMLAVVWAPLVEESLFRGGLYHYLRGRLGVTGSVLAVSVVFAAIHPQGFAGIPFLATLAIVLALTREWRDSILASVTLHMVHNALATLLLLVLVS